MEGHFKSLLSTADTRGRARLLAAQQKESESVRIAVGLRLGVSLCVPHTCPHCGMDVDHSGVHELSCRNSKGRIPRHSALNDNHPPSPDCC